VPLAEAVVFAMFASYSFANDYSDHGDVSVCPRSGAASEFLFPVSVPVGSPGFMAGSSTHSIGWWSRYSGLLSQCLEHRKIFIALLLVFCLSSLIRFRTSVRTSFPPSMRGSSGCICVPRLAPD